MTPGGADRTPNPLTNDVRCDRCDELEMHHPQHDPARAWRDDCGQTCDAYVAPDRTPDTDPAPDDAWETWESDVRSTLGGDGADDRWNDWVTDKMRDIRVFTERALAASDGSTPDLQLPRAEDSAAMLAGADALEHLADHNDQVLDPPGDTETAYRRAHRLRMIAGDPRPDAEVIPLRGEPDTGHGGVA